MIQLLCSTATPTPSLLEAVGNRSMLDRLGANGEALRPELVFLLGS